jgi:hypothetical protein
MKNIITFLCLVLLASCISSKQANLLEINVIDRNGIAYTDYIIKISDEKGEFIYSHVINDRGVDKVKLGLKPGIYKITGTCVKTSIDGEKLVNYSGRGATVTLQIPNTQFWLKEAAPVVKDK